MTREEVIEKTNEFLIEDIEIEESILENTDAKLKEDLHIDSLDFVDIVVLVEKKFGFKIKPEEMVEVKTLNQFYDYVYSKINK
jgi:acyl carrier protein